MVKNLIFEGFRELFLESKWVPQTFLFVIRVPRSKKVGKHWSRVRFLEIF